MTPEEAAAFNRSQQVSAVNGMTNFNTRPGPPGGSLDAFGSPKPRDPYDVDTSNVDALTARAYGYQGQVGNQAAGLSRAATGAGYRGQIASAQALQELGRPQTGPSAAELAMRAQSGQAQQQNLAMAASGAGPSNASLALNAMNRNAMQQGELNAQLGIQRARESDAQRAQQMQALGMSGQMYGSAAGTQMAGLQGAGSLYGQNASQTNQLAGLYGGIAQQNSQNALQYKQMQMQEEARQDAMFAQYLGAGMSAAGAVASGGATMVAQGAANSGGSWGKSGSNGYTGEGLTYSDIRAKKDIKPAERDISELYRGIDSANAQAAQVRGAPGVADTFGNLSGSSYGYVDPRLGNGKQTNFGPMAQELERTPAGQSVVTQAPNGMKGVDTSRLALLNASETGQQRREIDRLKAQLAAIQGQGDQIRSLPPAVRPEGYGY